MYQSVPPGLQTNWWRLVPLQKLVLNELKKHKVSFHWLCENFVVKDLVLYSTIIRIAVRLVRIVLSSCTLLKKLEMACYLCQILQSVPCESCIVESLPKSIGSSVRIHIVLTGVAFDAVTLRGSVRLRFLLLSSLLTAFGGLSG